MFDYVSHCILSEELNGVDQRNEATVGSVHWTYSKNICNNNNNLVLKILESVMSLFWKTCHIHLLLSACVFLD